jgi:hypothetical protein
MIGSRLHRLLVFLRLVDVHDRRLSLTSLALIIALVKLALLTTVGLPDLTAFFVAMLAYGYKRHTAAKSHTNQANGAEAMAQVTKLTDQVTGLISDLKQHRAEVAAQVGTVLLGRR